MSEERLDTVKGNLADCGNFNDALAAENTRIADEGAAADESALLAGMIEAAYLIGMADGEMSQDEVDALTEGLYHLTDITQDTLATLYGVAQARVENEGHAARLAALGNDITDEDHRKGTMLVAAAVSWKSGGVSTKKGLALQALARSFDMPILEMQKILGKAHG